MPSPLPSSPRPLLAEREFHADPGSAVRPRRFGINQYWIKLAMAALMVTDHLEHVPGLIDPNLALAFHVITRCVAVWFAYGAVEGVLHTRDLRRYLIRLWGAAAIMFLGNALLTRLLATRGLVHFENNIFLTLAIGVSLIAVARMIVNPMARGVYLAVMGVVGAVVGGIVEGGNVIIPFMLITFAAYRRPVVRDIGYVLFAVVLFAMSWVPYSTPEQTLSMLAFNSDFMLILVIPVLHLYNGERGPHTAFSKYFFYVFYPAHLWLLALIAYMRA
ncbi:conjugal transfer protein TraX [Actinomyces sp. B33]|uniref:TraX family protein n=1 Tax=Actinomyces sp. B33 TaxID=2942131 RepID=UPI002340549E|nr:TraX family protein [Actinomyces sp. B33]MDC4232768.1 conjugal transfer protein TraX [Actinomyces sp. B33]